MLSLGQIRGKTCQAVSRRAFLGVGTIGALGLTLGDFLALRAAAARRRPPPGP